MPPIASFSRYIEEGYWQSVEQRAEPDVSDIWVSRSYGYVDVPRLKLLE